MATVRKLDEAMIESFFKTANVRYLKDSEGDYLAQYAYDENTKCEITLYLIRAGEKKEVLHVLVLSDAAIPADELGAAVFFCNTWNKEKRWPKAFLVHEENAPYGSIRCEEQIDLEQGVHQELFNDFVTTAFSAGNQFWKEVAKQRPFSFKR